MKKKKKCADEKKKLFKQYNKLSAGNNKWYKTCHPGIINLHRDRYIKQDVLTFSLKPLFILLELIIYVLNIVLLLIYKKRE